LLIRLFIANRPPEAQTFWLQNKSSLKELKLKILSCSSWTFSFYFNCSKF
jgi:hypothetical protein